LIEVSSIFLISINPLVKSFIIPNKVMLEQRPEAVNNKERYGDWEGDTIIGAAHQGAILTLVERKSKRFAAAIYLHRKSRC
jgi:transposase, IS30 family